MLRGTYLLPTTGADAYWVCAFLCCCFCSAACGGQTEHAQAGTPPSPDDQGVGPLPDAQGGAGQPAADGEPDVVAEPTPPPSDSAQTAPLSAIVRRPENGCWAIANGYRNDYLLTLHGNERTELHRDDVLEHLRRAPDGKLWFFARGIERTTRCGIEIPNLPPPTDRGDDVHLMELSEGSLKQHPGLPDPIDLAIDDSGVVWAVSARRTCMSGDQTVLYRFEGEKWTQVEVSFDIFAGLTQAAGTMYYFRGNKLLELTTGSELQLERACADLRNLIYTDGLYWTLTRSVLEDPVTTVCTLKESRAEFVRAVDGAFTDFWLDQRGRFWAVGEGTQDPETGAVSYGLFQAEPGIQTPSEQVGAASRAASGLVPDTEGFIYWNAETVLESDGEQLRPGCL